MAPWWNELANLIGRLLAERWLSRNDGNDAVQPDPHQGADESACGDDGGITDPKERKDDIDGSSLAEQ